ncbi:diaphanous isoform X1, partial [Brachionus plicatilis]
MSKEPFKSFINKVGTFRSKKNLPNQRPSASDLRFSDINDENMFKADENSSSIHDSDLDTTSKSFSSANNVSFRSSVQALAASHLPNLNIYDQMNPEQINEEFEKNILSGLNLKSDKDIEKMRSLPLESKKSLLINMRKNENEMDDKPTNMANYLREAVRNSKNLKENLKHLYKAIKRISVCIASKPVSWLEEFSHASGFQALQEIITDYKTKYSILYNNNSGNQYYNSNFLTGTLLSNQSGYNSNEFKDKDTQLSKEIRFECIKTLKSFINTSYGISVVLDSKPTLMAIATCIDCNDTPTMNVACTLLAVLAVLDQEKVLTAIAESAKFTGNHRFYSIVKGITINDDKELKISSMILINALICNADSLDFKIHLRSDFNRCGLALAID